MARSSRPVPSKRPRRSLRLQQGQPPSDSVPENVARAPRSSSRGSSTSSTQSAPETEDGPYRNLRSRVALQDKSEQRKTSSNVLRNTTNAPDRKRSGSSQPTSSKRKKVGAVSVKTSDEALSTHPPVTRRQHQQLNQVTPSPAPNPTSAVFTFNSPKPRSRSFKSRTLPEGVVDLYSTKTSHSTQSCNCGVQHCSPQSLNASFIQSYGKEYWTYMRENEEPAIHPPTPSTNGSHSGSVLSPKPNSSCSSDSSPDSLFSQYTPDRRRDWVYLDTSSISVAQPSESSQFLHYQPELTPKMRAILVDWVIELSEHFSFGPSTLHLAITLVDKVLACGPLGLDDDTVSYDSGYDDCAESRTNCFLVSRERFQLLGAGCTWLACKMEELSPPNVSQIAYVADNIYTVEQIKRMERRICQALNFSLLHQTPYPYVFEFMRASAGCENPNCEPSSSPRFHHMVMYLMELGRLPYAPVTQKPSLLAAAAVYLARVTLGIGSSDVTLDKQGRWTRSLQYYTGYTKRDLQETVLAIHQYHVAAEDSSLKSAFTKYRTKKYHRVALKTVPRQEDLGFEI